MTKQILQRDDRRDEAEKIIDFTLVASRIGEPITSWAVKDLRHKRDNSLDKYLIYIEGDKGNYYLYRNTNYQMRLVYQNMSVLQKALPCHMPHPLGYIAEIDSILVDDVKGNNLLEKFPALTEAERLEIFRKTGMAMREFHNIPAERLQLDVNRYTQTLEGIMGSINKNSLSIIEQEDSAFFEELQRLYQLIRQHESQLQKKSGLSIVQGDLHPGNIFVSENENIVFLDIDDVTIALPERDIGTFLEQTGSMLHEQLDLASEAEVQKYNWAFLDGYKGKETDAMRFYRAWIAWRNAMYFRSKIDPDTRLAGISLESVRKHLDIIGLL